MSTSLAVDPILPFLTVPPKTSIQATLTKHRQPEELCLILPLKTHSLITDLDQSTQSLLLHKIKSLAKPSLEWGQLYNDAASFHTTS